ncbi:hypothetical protein D3C81_2105420 [compost metagenome]
MRVVPGGGPAAPVLADIAFERMLEQHLEAAVALQCGPGVLAIAAEIGEQRVLSGDEVAIQRAQQALAKRRRLRPVDQWQ